MRHPGPRPARALASRTTSDPLAEGTESHYQDARHYTANYQKRVEDIDYYLSVAESHGGRVLEYGCGNGRIALPLAHAGFDVAGVDLSATMLRDFRARLKKTPAAVAERVTLKRGDMRRVKLDRRFDLVLCTFNTFLHLYTWQDVERFLTRVREHLAPRGRFVVDLSIPMPEELARDPKRLFRAPRFRHVTTGEMVRYGERFAYDPLTQVEMVDMVFEPVDRPRAKWVTPLAHRQFYPQELEALFHYNGLEVVKRHADFKPKTPTRDAETLIYHCRARRSTSRSVK